MIGIKLADRSFFPIVTEEGPAKRRVLLSAARDHQDRVNIVLYRELAVPSGTHQRIGSLDFLQLPDRSMSESEFELVVSVDELGRVEAHATDTTSGDSRDLAVDPNDLPLDLDDNALGESGGVERVVTETRPRRRVLWMIPVAIILLAALAFALWYFLPRERTRTAEGADLPTTEAASPAEEIADEPITETAQPEVEPEEEPNTETSAPEEQAESVELVAEEQPQSEEPVRSRIEVPYEIIRGDTLWDISIEFYGTPWRFRDIAERNEIRNPDLIYADDDIVIPAEP